VKLVADDEVVKGVGCVTVDDGDDESWNPVFGMEEGMLPLGECPRGDVDPEDGGGGITKEEVLPPEVECVNGAVVALRGDKEGIGFIVLVEETEDKFNEVRGDIEGIGFSVFVEEEKVIELLGDIEGIGFNVFVEGVEKVMELLGDIEGIGFMGGNCTSKVGTEPLEPLDMREDLVGIGFPKQVKSYERTIIKNINNYAKVTSSAIL
jgi:hypothetical protein